MAFKVSFDIEGQKNGAREQFYTLYQARAKLRLSYSEISKAFDEYREKRVSYSYYTVINILLRKNLDVYGAVRKPMMTRERLTRLRYVRRELLGLW